MLSMVFASASVNHVETEIIGQAHQTIHHPPEFEDRDRNACILRFIVYVTCGKTERQV